MHEMYLAESMLNELTLSADREGITHISKIKLVNGELSGVNSEAIKFAFSLLCKADLFKEVILEIAEPRLAACCSGCKKVFEITDCSFICPYCANEKLEIISGQELYIDYYEGE